MKKFLFAAAIIVLSLFFLTGCDSRPVAVPIEKQTEEVDRSIYLSSGDAEAKRIGYDSLLDVVEKLTYTPGHDEYALNEDVVVVAGREQSYRTIGRGPTAYGINFQLNKDAETYGNMVVTATIENDPYNVSEEYKTTMVLKKYLVSDTAKAKRVIKLRTTKDEMTLAKATFRVDGYLKTVSTVARYRYVPEIVDATQDASGVWYSPTGKYFLKDKLPVCDFLKKSKRIGKHLRVEEIREIPCITIDVIQRIDDN